MCVCVCVHACMCVMKAKGDYGEEKKVSWIKKGVGGTKGKAAKGWARSFYETQTYLQPVVMMRKKKNEKKVEILS